MFITENVKALFKKGTLKMVPTEDGYQRVAEATVVIEPFEPDLARELGEDVAGHLFNDDGGILPELGGIDLRVRLGAQRVTARPDPEMEACAILSPVTLKDVSVQRIEDKKTGESWLACSFVLVFALDSRVARTFVLDEFGKPLYFTFESIQQDLIAAAEVRHAAQSLREQGPRAH